MAGISVFSAGASAEDPARQFRSRPRAAASLRPRYTLCRYPAATRGAAMPLRCNATDGDDHRSPPLPSQRSPLMTAVVQRRSQLLRLRAADAGVPACRGPGPFWCGAERAGSSAQHPLAGPAHGGIDFGGVLVLRAVTDATRRCCRQRKAREDGFIDSRLRRSRRSGLGRSPILDPSDSRSRTDRPG